MENVLKPRIVVVGVGGAGGNAVNNMIQSKLEGVDFLVANTDCQAIEQSNCERHIQLGRGLTQGLGAGSQPEIGRAAAEETLDEIQSAIEDASMVFITAGMGGGTGTGSAPVLARAAREAKILTIAVVTKPFHFEGVRRMRIAEAGIEELSQYVDSVIVIPNQNLFRVANQKTTFADAFKLADEVLYSGVRGVTDLVVMPGLINLDFADIQSVMAEMGKAMIGTGEAEGDNRALAAAEAAISNPLLDDVSMKEARGVLINITGGADLTLFEVDETANRIREEIDPEANIIFGSAFDPSLKGRMRVSVVATGIKARQTEQPKQAPISPAVDDPAEMRAEQDASASEIQAGAATEGATEAPVPEPHHAEQVGSDPQQSAAGPAVEAAKTTLVSADSDRGTTAQDGVEGPAEISAPTVETWPNQEVTAKSEPAPAPEASVPTPEPDAGAGLGAETAGPPA